MSRTIVLEVVMRLKSLLFRTSKSSGIGLSGMWRSILAQTSMGSFDVEQSIFLSLTQHILLRFRNPSPPVRKTQPRR